MRYAKSIYRGGMLADALTCDYESARKLGLACPFCNQAVFLRRGTFYDRDGKQIVVQPAFAHYKNDDPLSEDCELRAVRKDGEEYLKRLDVESHNQRLDLYNKRLWDVIREDMRVGDIKKTIDKHFEQKWLEESAKLCRHELRRSLEFYQEEARQIWKEELKGRFNLSDDLEAAAAAVWTSEERLEAIQKLCKFDQQLHQVVMEEIIEFLSTRTAGYVLVNLLRMSLWIMCCNVWISRIQTKAPPDAIPAFASFVKAGFLQQPFKQRIDRMIKTIIILIVRTNWIKLFYSLESEDAE